MKIWFTSDLHLGHVRILEYTERGKYWSTPEEMNEAIIANWNEVVDTNDQVLVIGDFAMGKIDETLPLALQLKGSKKIVAGNHDRISTLHNRPKDIAKLPYWRARYEEVGFEILPEQFKLPVNGFGEVTVCHFPPFGDSHDEDRYEKARPKDDGGIFIHGHVHGHVSRNPNGRFFDVGVDAWEYYPVTLDQILGVTDA